MKRKLITNKPHTLRENTKNDPASSLRLVIPKKSGLSSGDKVYIVSRSDSVLEIIPEEKKAMIKSIMPESDSVIAKRHNVTEEEAKKHLYSVRVKMFLNESGDILWKDLKPVEKAAIEIRMGRK